MYFLGIDCGSVSTKIVVLKDSTVLYKEVARTTANMTEGAVNLYQKCLAQLGLKKEDLHFSVATGYGRKHLEFVTKTVTEISSQAKGIYSLYPSARIIIDIGGQDTKVIKLREGGRVANFYMNEKCAAGTGRFLETVARALGIDVTKLGPLSDKAKNRVPISSTCAVFAESEVVGQMARGTPVEDIVAGIHQAMSERIVALVERVGIEGNIIFTGGVARNSGMVKMIGEKLGVDLQVPPEPEITGALGAALIASVERKVSLQ